MKISVLDQTQLLEGISAEEAFAQSVELAKYVDQLGYHRYWLSEHHSSDALAGSSPEILASHLLAKTDNIKVGTGGVMLPHYSAYKVAENFKVMSALAPGRVDMGVGRAPGGHHLSTRALQGDKVRNVDIFPEQIDQVLEYLEDRLPDLHPIRGLETTPVIKKKPDVWILGTSNSSGLLAAEKGLPYAFAQFINYQPGGMDQALKLYVDHFKPSKYLDQPQVLVTMKIIVADTDEEAEKIAQSALRFNYYLHRGRLTRLVDPERALSHVINPAEKREIEAVKETYIIGSKETVAQKIKDLTDQFPIDELMAITPIYNFEKRKRSFELLKEAVSE
ncbi:LLM class flavin-dependent oxidoreductase [Domibacillus sp. DTU_2020_1001157_1_SI_ALB_TIR_016]|uniref:LLM class flavin-dependent oxidoreductase n=1 Tax=Domibacillus sp. DTU_2020_1001157_1_SI_ALB_TIR_016 TaxID=3077789 RepID=UPI0028F0E977|nr:LLM class flavin-dependent oxidoreductase [Domibacillus sp. DTU_2020_1001157_1_SI_ALB_TIR_016]WNS79575.1 LLM class flavin-dependent oxidoreductase [Domibacillus sp. DTU_2020_1001157_1_SI_ALB_TIR_016]